MSRNFYAVRIRSHRNIGFIIIIIIAVPWNRAVLAAASAYYSGHERAKMSHFYACDTKQITSRGRAKPRLPQSDDRDCDDDGRNDGVMLQ